ncbi:MAG: DUF134 domain-containing protein [Bacteroidales bacterium]|nr:DUF134 domain-containing protein [Bacteroidales bacterium]
MPRRRRLRRILAPPGFKGYKPYGVFKNPKEAIILLYEEYEAIKLADYDGMNHLEASVLMGVSRSTFARIYESARRNVAKAFVETKEIIIDQGHARIDENWYLCNDCHARFSIPSPKQEMLFCPVCKKHHIEPVIIKDIY